MKLWQSDLKIITLSEVNELHQELKSTNLDGNFVFSGW
jgi:hypothetical protein